MTNKSRTAICGWCGCTFQTTGGRGLVPRYCSRSHRQRAYEARRSAGGDGPDLAELGNALAGVRRALGRGKTTPAQLVTATQSLANAAADLLGEKSVTVTQQLFREPPPVADKPARPRQARPPKRPWKVLLHGGDPASGTVLTGHTTEGAANSSLRRLQTDWERYQPKAERARWTWTVIHDPRGSLPEGIGKDEAADTARRIFVRLPDEPVTYQRQPHPKRPDIVDVTRKEGTFRGEPLHQRWHRNPFEPFPDPHRPGLGRHPYAAYLLQDACGLAYIPTSETARTYDLMMAAETFATEMLENLGDTWTLPLADILAWTSEQGLTRVISASSPA